jgi:hypothetical protein
MPAAWGWSVAIVLVLARAAAPAPFDPTSSYEKRTVHGFSVLVNPRLLEHEAEAAEAFEELDAQLGRIVRAVPPGPLAKLRKVRIWMEWEAKPDGAAEFHPSKQWLGEHGYNPDKAGGIELSNARNFVRWSRGEQPWMVFHELAHSYHFLTLGEDHPGVLDAYRHADQGKLYESVEYVKGGRQKAYAMNNPKEYFAEISEAYFGKNDFYPFDRDDLRTHDPVGYKLLQKVWGRPRGEPEPKDAK